MTDWAHLRSLLRKLAAEGSQQAVPGRIFVESPGAGPPPMPSERASKEVETHSKSIGDDQDFFMRFSFPDTVGKEFEYWKLAHELGLVNARRDDKRGIGNPNPGGQAATIESLTILGREFVELAEPDERWTRCLEIVKGANAATWPNIIGELRHLAREEIRRHRNNRSK